jgi:hypothetical protein
MRYAPLVGDQLTGHLGGIVASRNTYGLYLKQRRSPVNRRTPFQIEQRNALTFVTGAWRALDPAVQALWTAARLVKKSRRGFTVTLTGQGAFMWINTMRQRLGLTILNDPPTSADPLGITIPVVSVSAPNAVHISFGAGDPWDLADGGCIVSVTPILSPGVTYAQSFLGCGLVLGPTLGTANLTLPFDVPAVGGDRLRFRFHATGPDGRQSDVVDADTVTSAGATGVSAVRFVSATEALWEFDNAVTATGVNDPVFHVNGVAATATSQAGPTAVLCTYPAATCHPGDAWAIATVPVQVTAIPAIAAPQSGHLL